MDVVVAGSTLTRKYNPDELGRVRIELSGNAQEVGSGNVVLPDPSAVDNIAGGRQFKVSEGVALLSDGFIGVQIRGRGHDRAATAVEGLYTVDDANALLHGKRMTGWNRSAESDRARVLARAAIDLPGVDTTWVLATNLATMEKKTYSTVGWDELMRDVFEYTGKIVFLHDKANGTGRCLHSHKETEGHACGLSINDDPSLLGATVFAPQQPSRNRSARGLENDILARDQSGRTAYASDSGSVTAHDADGMKHQGIVDFTATSQADLQAKANAYIVEGADEIDIYSCVIGPLDQTALRLIRVGDRITVDSQTLDLVGTIRIAHMGLTVTRDAEGNPVPGFWDADLELGEAIRLRPKVTSGRGVTVVGSPPFQIIEGADHIESDTDRSWIIGVDSGSGDPFVTSDTDNLVETFIIGTGIFADRHPSGSPQEEIEGRLFVQHTAPSGAGAGRVRTRLFAVSLAANGTPPQPLTWKVYQGNWNVAPGGTTVVPRTPNFVQDPAFGDILRDGALLPVVLGSGSLDAGWFDAAIPFVTNDMPDPGGYIDLDIVVPVVDNKLQFVLGFGIMAALNDTTDTTPRYPSIDVGESAHDVLAMTRNLTLELNDAYQNTGYSIEWLTDVTPALGQPVLGEVVGVGNSTTVAYFTLYPYLPGSLVVRLDGLHETHVVETDPTTGEFTFDTAPRGTSLTGTSEVITVDYMGTG